MVQIGCGIVDSATNALAFSSFILFAEMCVCLRECVHAAYSVCTSMCVHEYMWPLDLDSVRSGVGFQRWWKGDVLLTIAFTSLISLLHY